MSTSSRAALQGCGFCSSLEVGRVDHSSLSDSTCTAHRRRVDLNRVSNTTGTALTRTLRTAGTLQGVPPSCCGRRVRCGVACVRADHQGLEKRHWRRKQPANLAVEGAEESLSILFDYTPTVRPPRS
jgi:hypothetical protein